MVPVGKATPGLSPGSTRQQRSLIPTLGHRISTSDLHKSCSQALSQPGPQFKSVALWMGGSFQSLRPVVFGHGFDRMAADNSLCQLSFKARKVLWPWYQAEGTAETLQYQTGH